MCFFIAFWTLSLITLCCFGLLLYFHPAFCFWFTAMLTHVCLKYWFQCFLVYLYFLGSLFFLLLLLLSYTWLLQPEFSEFPVIWLIEYPNILQTFSLNLCLLFYLELFMLLFLLICICNKYLCCITLWVFFYVLGHRTFVKVINT